MESISPEAERSLLSAGVGFAVLVILVSASVFVLQASYDRTLTPNDTAQYLSIARHLCKGEGLKTDLVFFMEHHAQKTMPIEETGFAPGYPLLVAGSARLACLRPRIAFRATRARTGRAFRPETPVLRS